MNPVKGKVPLTFRSCLLLEVCGTCIVIIIQTLREKCPYSELFCPNAGKYGPE